MFSIFATILTFYFFSVGYCRIREKYVSDISRKIVHGTKNSASALDFLSIFKVFERFISFIGIQRLYHPT